MVDKEENSGWKYTPSKAEDSGSVAEVRNETVSWAASEYIDHKRGFSWYVLLILATTAIAAAVYLITKDYFATGIIAIMGLIVGLFARQKPREITYELDGRGLKIGDKFYTFSSFKSFSVITDGALKSISFTPLKRLMPPISAYYAPQDEQKIINALSQYLPYEENTLDAVDKLARRLRL